MFFTPIPASIHIELVVYELYALSFHQFLRESLDNLGDKSYLLSTILGGDSSVVEYSYDIPKVSQ